MSQIYIRRRTLASSDANPRPAPLSASSSSVTTKTKSKTLDSTKHVLMSSHFPRLNPNHHEVPKPTTKDIHMQPKSMTLFADSAPLIKHGPINLAKAERILPQKEFVREKKPPKDLDGKKRQQEIVGLRKKDVQGTVTVTKGFHGKNVEPTRISASLSLGRRSLRGSRLELGDILANCGVRIVSVDMPPFMQIHAIDFARKTHDSLEKFSPKSLALSLKKEFDGAYGPAWHCIVGSSFGSFVTHSVGGFVYFSMDQKLYFLLFKTTVQRAN